MTNYIKINNQSLKEYNTLRLDSYAEIILFPLNEEGIIEILKKYSHKKMIFLGSGANILLSKEYYNESFIFISFKFMDKVEINNDKFYVQAGATLSKLSWTALEHNISGLEFLEDVPGTLGGAIVMNAGTYKDMIGDFLLKVTSFNFKKNRIETSFCHKEDFGKRYSTWGTRGDLIISAELNLEKLKKENNYELILKKILDIKERRYLKQPRNFPNAGSVFKRPTKDGEDYFVWKLIDGCNLRGFKVGDAQISKKHPGFIINIDKATSEDVLTLIEIIKREIYKMHEIELEIEWKII